MRPLKDREYLVKFKEGANFELQFCVDDNYYEASSCKVSVREIVFQSSRSFRTLHKVCKLICKNRSHPVTSRKRGVKNVYVNLALVDVRLNSGETHLIVVNSTPMKITILNRKIEFSLIDIIERVELNSDHWFSAFARIAITPDDV